MFVADSLVLDLVFSPDARPTADQILDGLGGEEVARSRVIVDADLDVPQIEEIAPTVLLRQRGERRLLIVDEATAPLREDPRTQPIVARDLRPERDRLVHLVDRTGARLGRIQAFGAWGDAVVVVRTLRDLRALVLQLWALDPQVDLDGRRRTSPLSPQEHELKLAAYDKRLDELDDATILSRIPPAVVARGGEAGDLWVIDVLSDRDGSWDVRKSLELERSVAALELFSRIPGARQSLAPEPEPEPAPTPAAPAPAPAPAEPPTPAGPPITAVELEGRVILRIPEGRLDLDAITALGKRQADVLTSRDQVTGRQRDRIHADGCGFVAPLVYLSQVFLDGRPLDRKRFEAESGEVVPGARALEAHLPRFGPVLVVEVGGKRWVSSELTPGRVLGLIG